MIRLGLLASGALLLAAAGPGLESDMLGDWTRRDGAAKIRVAPCGDQICAVNTWVRDPDGDEKVGDVLRMTLHQTSPDALSGDAHDVRRDMNVSMDVTFSGSDMRTSGCMLFGVLCKSAEWSRGR